MDLSDTNHTYDTVLKAVLLNWDEISRDEDVMALLNPQTNSVYRKLEADSVDKKMAQARSLSFLISMYLTVSYM